MLRFVVGTLLYLGFAVISPVALVAAPLGLLLLLQRPTAREALIGALLLGFVGYALTHPGAGFGRVEAAWVCLLAGSVAVVVAAAQNARGRLVTVGLAAVGVAALASMLVIAATPITVREILWLASRHYSVKARMFLELAAAQFGGAPNGSETVAMIEATLDQIVALITRLLPALVLLQSMAALAASWALYRWLVARPEGEPLPRLREFRFSDHLIWGVVLALIGLVFPGPRLLGTIGGNLATFFGGLYVVRGLGIVAALAAAAGVGGPVAGILASFLVIFLWPFVMFGALALGVTDTWVDWRRLAMKKADN